MSRSIFFCYFTVLSGAIRLDFVLDGARAEKVLNTGKYSEPLGLKPVPEIFALLHDKIVARYGSVA